MLIKLVVDCPLCVEGTRHLHRHNGPGQVEEYTEPCDCDGGLVDMDGMNRLVFPDGIFLSVEVYEAIDEDEYDNLDLSDKNRGRIDFMLSAGMVDLTEDSKARGTLWEIFGSESTTRANLVALIGG